MSPPTVLFVGADLPLSPHAHGIFRRCGFVVREYGTLDQVRDALDGWTPTFVVAVFRWSARSGEQVSLAALRAFLEFLDARPTRPTVIAMCPRAVDKTELGACRALGLHALHANDIPHRRLAQKLIDLLGGNGASCCQAASDGNMSSRTDQPAARVRARGSAPPVNPRRTKRP